MVSTGTKHNQILQKQVLGDRLELVLTDATPPGGILTDFEGFIEDKKVVVEKRVESAERLGGRGT